MLLCAVTGLHDMDEFVQAQLILAVPSPSPSHPAHGSFLPSLLLSSAYRVLASASASHFSSSCLFLAFGIPSGDDNSHFRASSWRDLCGQDLPRPGHRSPLCPAQNILPLRVCQQAKEQPQLQHRRGCPPPVLRSSFYSSPLRPMLDFLSIHSTSSACRLCLDAGKCSAPQLPRPPSSMEATE